MPWLGSKSILNCSVCSCCSLIGRGLGQPPTQQGKTGCSNNYYNLNRNTITSSQWERLQWHDLEPYLVITYRVLSNLLWKKQISPFPPCPLLSHVETILQPSLTWCSLYELYYKRLQGFEFLAVQQKCRIKRAEKLQVAQSNPPLFHQMALTVSTNPFETFVGGRITSLLTTE